MIAGLIVCAPGYAQTLYRCGNKYQDRPCDAGQKSKAVGSTGVGAAADASSADAQCAQLGKDSLKIVWSREGGATEEALVSAARTGTEKRFVQDVYRRRGSASQVQAAIEADCVAEKERQAQAAALEAAAARLRGDQRPMPGGAVEPAREQPVADPQAAERLRAQAADREAEQKKSRCTSLNSRMDSLAAQQRAGGSASAMERLNESRRQLQSEMSRAGC